MLLLLCGEFTQSPLTDLWLLLCVEQCLFFFEQLQILFKDLPFVELIYYTIFLFLICKIVCLSYVFSHLNAFFVFTLFYKNMSLNLDSRNKVSVSFLLCQVLRDSSDDKKKKNNRPPILSPHKAVRPVVVGFFCLGHFLLK